ncbi:MAG: PAS domain-containing protein [Psychromonas sp.]|nr:PAS domain-containing protein [Psychromonas sp.]
MTSVFLTGKDISCDPQRVIVSKTDLRGNIIYANDVFINISGYCESELLNVNHNIIRHPLMARGIFRFMWEQLKKDNEFFAFVVNQCKNGDHYWVFAHVTSTKDIHDNINGYYSVRRMMPEKLKPTITALYEKIRATENGLDKKRATKASYDFFVQYLKNNNIDYNAYICNLYRASI